MNELPQEAKITINGKTLTQTQVMTFRVALGLASMDYFSLPEGDPLRDGYLSNARAIQSYMVKTE